MTWALAWLLLGVGTVVGGLTMAALWAAVGSILSSRFPDEVDEGP